MPGLPREAEGLLRRIDVAAAPVHTAAQSKRSGAVMKNNGNNARDAGDGKDSSHSSPDFHPIIPPRGDYQTLHSFHKAEVVYDLTFRFAHKHLARATARWTRCPGRELRKKESLEGSKAALTSKETEIKLTNLGRASLEELLDG